MKSKEKLFFIALVPPEPLLTKVAELKQKVAIEFGVRAALKSPPHITLHMPFKLKERKEIELLGVLEKIKIEPPTVQFHGIGSFEPRVLFLKILESPGLHILEKTVHSYLKPIQIFNNQYKGKPFHPHLTLAFRDLKKEAFYTAWERYKALSFESQFVANEFSLLKHNGSVWEVYKTFSLR